MKNRNTTFVLFFLLFGCFVGNAWSLQPETPDPDGRSATQQQDARQQILDSKRWRIITRQLDEWISVQTFYDDEQAAQLRDKLERQVAITSATELEDLLDELETKLKVLLSPEMSEARSWVTQYFTRDAQKKMADKAGFDDPAKMTASQIRAALKQFEMDRRPRRTAAAAFGRARERQNEAIRASRRSLQLAAERSNARSSVNRTHPYPSHCAPHRPQRSPRYRPAYPLPRYSVGPWGGVWRSFGG